METTASRNVFFCLRTYKRTILFFAFVFILLNNARAAQGQAGTGSWSNTTTWNFNGVNRLPACGDTLIIPAGITVTVRTQENYSACGQKIYISVSGTLQFVNGYKLELPCSSLVVLNSGGTIRKATPGGGNSTFLKICECISWIAADGNISGPSLLGCSTLPMELLSFTADETEMGVELHWTTASESNNNYFTCERSRDGKNYESLGIVSGAGTSSELREYVFTDYNPSAGKSYYRLSQTDRDGGTSSAGVVAVNYRIKQSLKFLSAHLDENRQMAFSCLSTGKMLEVSIYDVTGKKIFGGGMNTVRGLNRLVVSSQTLRAGSYILSVTDGEDHFSKKVVVIEN